MVLNTIYCTPGWSSLKSVNEQIMKSEISNSLGNKSKHWIALGLCAAVLIAGVVKQFIDIRLNSADSFAPRWISIAASVFAAVGIIQFNNRLRWLQVQRVLLWGGIMLMVWTANGLPFDLLCLTPLMPQETDWPGMVTRTLALAAVIVLARLAMATPITSGPNHKSHWYGYAAFVLALPYPVLRTFWAFGGTIGLTHAGAAGVGFAPLIIAIPWVLAAVLSLLLVSKRPWLPRRLLLIAGWSATTIFAMIGPAAFWMIITSLAKDGVKGPDGMAIWVPFLFYTSWFLFAIAIGAATFSYQLRSESTANINV